MSWFGKKDEPDDNSDKKTSEVGSSNNTLNSQLPLKVDSAYPGDQGGGKIRLDPVTMLNLKISLGDVVAIEGKRRTVAKVWRSLVEDWNQNKCRIDNFTRINAGVAIGDSVKISTLTEEIEAKRVVLAPPEDLPKKIPIANNPHVINGLLDFPVVKNDSIPIMLGLPFVQPQIVAFKVVEIEPEEAVIITKNTSIEFSDRLSAGFEGVKRITYNDIGGLKDQIKQIREIIDLPLHHPELFQTLGVEAPKGILLFGPSGTGKTFIGKAIANENGAHFISIAGPEVMSKYVGESEQRIREVFDEAREKAPSIIFIDELESIARDQDNLDLKKTNIENANNVNVGLDIERRVVAQLLTMMDGLEERGQVVVIGITRRIDLIEPALRRSGRFDREIEIGLPNELARIEILTIHTRAMPLAIDVSIANIAKQTNDFSGADLAELCKEAALCAIKRSIPDELVNNNFSDNEIPKDILKTLVVSSHDFQEAIAEINNKIINQKRN